jgi:hypothetical protein
MATRYWVGGSGTWDASTTTNWSATSGGAGGASAPVAADTVIFDSASGTGICTTAAGSACAIATLNSATLAVTLGADHTMSGAFTLTLGSLNLSSFTLTCNIFSSTNTNTRSIAFGTGKLLLTGGNTGSVIVSMGTMTGFTYTGTSNIELNYSGALGTRSLNIGSTGGTEALAMNISVSAGTDIISVTNNSIFKNLIFTGFAGTLSNTAKIVYGNVVFSTGMTVSAGTLGFSFLATSGTQQITTNGKTLDFPITQNGVGGTVQLEDNLTMGSTRTFTLTAGTLQLNNQTLSTGLFNSSNSNTRSIDFKSGNITLTGNNATVWGFNTATGFSYTGTPTVNFTYAGSTGTRNIYNGSTTGATESNSPNFNINAGSDTINFLAAVKSLNFTGFSGAYTTASGANQIYGDLTFSSTMTVPSSVGSIGFYATSGTQKITTNGVTINRAFALGLVGTAATIQCQDALNFGATYGITFSNGTLQLKENTTNIVNSFTTTGTTQKYLQSTVAGSQATLSQASGTVGVSYLTIQDINATGGATWNAFYDNNNVDAGNNTNWNFGGTPSYDAEYGYKLRSFTERGRF